MNSCEVEKPVRYFDLNSIRYNLYDGFMDDWGTNNSGVINTKYFAVSLRESEAYPSEFITFFIGSFDTDNLANGTYQYDFNGGRGLFSDMRIGVDLGYNNDGFFNRGIIFTEKEVSIDGIIRISRSSRGNIDFFFDLTLTVRDNFKSDFPEDTYELIGEFNDRLTLNANVVNLDLY